MPDQPVWPFAPEDPYPAYARARRDGAVQWSEALPRALEELLRFDSPTQAVSRFAGSDHTLAGQPVERGQRALVMLGAANRDPERHVNPDTLDLALARRPHLAFGHGPHFCLGAALARLEARAVFARLAGPLTQSREAGWVLTRADRPTLRRLAQLRIEPEQTPSPLPSPSAAFRAACPG